MSLQPSDPAADAFERLRSEVALLRRAVEGLAAGGGAELMDYSPTLAELSGAVAEVRAEVAALGERPALALAPEQLGALLQMAAGRILAKSLAELERERAVLTQAVEALRAGRQTNSARARSWRRVAVLIGAGAMAGVTAWGLLLGPVARTLPASWALPERLASATLALPMDAAADRLLRRGDPHGWRALQVVRPLPDATLTDLRRCIARSSEGGEPRRCTLKVGGSPA